MGQWAPGPLTTIDTNHLKPKINRLSEALQDFPLHSDNLQALGKFATNCQVPIFFYAVDIGKKGFWTWLGLVIATSGQTSVHCAAP